MTLFPRSMFLAGATRTRRAAFGAGGRGTAIPIMEAVVELPELMVSSKGRVARVINQATREALKKEILLHHRRRIPDHFNRFRQGKYRYQPRSERTRQIKQKLHKADLVRSGKTKSQMTRNITIRFPRTGGQGVSILGILKWPPGFRFNRAASRGVTPQVMADEISRWTLREEHDAANHIRDDFVEFLEQNLSRRAKIRMRAQLGRLGVRV